MVIDFVFEEVVSRVLKETSRLCSTKKQGQGLHRLFLDILQRETQYKEKLELEAMDGQ